MTNPFFSIVIPVYNGEPYLKKCVGSVLSQPNADFEIILVNDGSKDNSLNICREYSLKFDNITVISQENKGISAACNAGFGAASGKYIIQIDQDDEMEENVLFPMQQKIEENNFPDILQCNYSVLNDGKKEKSQCHLPQNKADLHLNRKEKLLKGLYFNEYPCSFWSRAVKREFLNSINFSFDDKMNGIQDIDGTLKCLLSTDNVYFYDISIYIYQIHKGSASHSAHIPYIFSKINFSQKYLHMFDDDEVDYQYLQLYKMWMHHLIDNVKKEIFFLENKKEKQNIYQYIAENAPAFDGHFNFGHTYDTLQGFILSSFKTKTAEKFFKFNFKIGNFFKKHLKK